MKTKMSVKKVTALLAGVTMLCNPAAPAWSAEILMEPVLQPAGSPVESTQEIELNSDEAHAVLSDSTSFLMNSGVLSAAQTPDLDDLTRLPGNPRPTTVSPPEAVMQVSQTARGIRFEFDTKTAGWTGGGFHFDQPNTGQVETADLQGMTQLVFGIQGDVNRVKFEAVDINNQKAVVYLDGITAGEEKAFGVSTSELASKGVDLSHIKILYFIVEGNHQQGELKINHIAPQSGPVQVGPSEQLSYRDIRPLPARSQGDADPFPRLQSLAAPGATAHMTPSDHGANLYMSTGDVGWAGGGLTYDDFNTAQVESMDFSNRGSIRLGLIGNSDVKLELVDDQNRKSFVYLTGIAASSQGKIWDIPLSLFEGIDLTRIKALFFIVEGRNKSASLSFDYYPTGSRITAGHLGSDGITPFDPRPQDISIAPQGALANVSSQERGLRLLFDTGEAGWAGAGLRFANQPLDLSDRSYLRLGVRAELPHLKVEFVDNQNKKAVVYFRNLKLGNENAGFVSINDLRSYGIDLRNITHIFFIVEGKRLSGSLDLNYIPSPVQPSSIHSINNINFPGAPDSMVLKPASAAASVHDTTRGFRLDYSIGQEGWVGAGFTYDDFSTPIIETAGSLLSSPLLLGLRGSASRAKVEFVDRYDNKVTIQIDGIRPDIEQVWPFSVGYLGELGLNPSAIRFVFVVMEGQPRDGFLVANRARPARLSELTLGEQYFPHGGPPLINLGIRDAGDSTIVYTKRIGSAESLGSREFSEIEATTKDGEYAVVSNAQTGRGAHVYLVPINDLSLGTQDIRIPVPAGALVSDYLVDTVQTFANGEVRLFLKNGQIISLLQNQAGIWFIF